MIEFYYKFFEKNYKAKIILKIIFWYLFCFGLDNEDLSWWLRATNLPT